ncbi:rRNA-processing protein las1 [Irineochytrium annulatum]|nr:rRNA-processing protein las1 [Irineochytrium annulatum]
MGGRTESEISAHEIRLMYAMAFIRFVNGLVDPAQRGNYASSVQSIAESLGLPAWFVDLRHAGTHDHLPSLPLLRSGCNQALLWLYENYWVQIRSYMTDTATDVRGLLGQYRQVVLETEPSKRVRGAPAPGHGLLSDVMALIQVEGYRDFLFPALLEDGCMVTKDDDRCLTLGNREDIQLTAAEERLWVPALEAFEQYWPGFADDLFFTMVGLLAEQPTGLDGDTDLIPVRTYGAGYFATIAAWSRTLLRMIMSKEGINAADVLSVCLRNPNKWTKPLIQDLGRLKPTLTEKLKPVLNYIDDLSVAAVNFTRHVPDRMETSDDENDDENVDDDDPEVALRLVRSRMERFRALRPKVDDVATMEGEGKGKEKEKEEVKGWSLAPETGWKGQPVGCVPGVGFPDLKLPLDWDTPGEGARRGIFVVPSNDVDPPVWGKGGKRKATVSVLTEAEDGMEDDEKPASPKRVPAVHFTDEDIERISKKIRIL